MDGSKQRRTPAYRSLTQHSRGAQPPSAPPTKSTPKHHHPRTDMLPDTPPVPRASSPAIPLLRGPLPTVAPRPPRGSRDLANPPACQWPWTPSSTDSSSPPAVCGCEGVWKGGCKGVEAGWWAGEG